jgi:hypothetical protein
VKAEIDETTSTWSKEEVLQVAEEWKEKARETFLKDGFHRPISFVFGTKNHETGEPRKQIGIVPVMGHFDEDEKQGYSHALREIVQKTGGVGIIFITEMWMVTTLGGDGGSAEVRKWTGNLHKHPDRSEHVMITCEHYRFGCLMWTAKIERPPGEPEGKPTLGPWLGDGRFPAEVGRPSNVKRIGRFVNILPRVD